MIIPIRWIKTKCRGRNMRLAGVSIAIAAVGFQVAGAADSTMRFLGSRDEVKPRVADNARAKRETIASRDSIVQRESTVRVATAASAVQGRQESTLFERRTAAPTAQADDITHAMREAVALREAINRPANAVVREQKAVAKPTAPPTTISALKLTKDAATTTTAAVSRQPVPAATAAIPVIRMPAPVVRAAEPLVASAPVVGTPAQATRVPTALVSEPAQTVPAPVPVVRIPATAEPAPTSVVRAPAPIMPAPSPVVRAPAPLVPAPSTVVRAPAPVAAAEAAAPVGRVPAAIAEEPVRVAQLPAAVEHVPATAVRTTSPAVPQAPPVASIAAAHATYHPHHPHAPGETHTHDHGITDNCPCDGGPEEYNLSDELGCAYGPGQSGSQFICGVDCGVYGAPCYAGWGSSHTIPWSLFGPGEYIGPSRSEHVSSYYLRVNDLITLTYINSRQILSERYRLGVGDRLRIESSVDESLDREVQVQPDGEISLPIVGEVMAAGKTVKELRDDLIDVFKEAQRQPQITVTPLEINTGQQEIIRAVKSEIGSNGQAHDLKVTPEGTIQAPGLGSVYVQGLTLEELRSELEARYAESFGSGLMISPALTERATSYVFIGGEVKTPGRYTLEGPTTATQAIAALGGSWNIGANLHQVVVFRRDENWCLKAIKIDVRAPLYGNDPCPVNDVWLRDNDLVIVPKSKILCATDVINLYFTRGVYAVFPVTFFQDLSRGSTVGAATGGVVGP